MKTAVIIHSRTYQLDFNSNFLFCPNDFNQEEIKHVGKIIRTATQTAKPLNGLRRIIITTDKHCVFGIICNLSTLVELCSSAQDPKCHIANKYTHDNYKRPIRAFIGMSVLLDQKPLGFLPDVSINKFYNIFEHYIATDDVWNNPIQNHFLSEYCETEVVNYLDNKAYIPKIDSGTIKWFLSGENDKDIFESYLSQIDKKNHIDLCTNFDSAHAISDVNFNVITAKESTIQQFLKSNEKKELSEDNQLSDKTDNLKETKKKLKKKTIQIAVYATSVIIIIVLITLCHKIK